MKVHQMTILLLLAKRSGGSQQRGAAGSRALMTAALLIASGREQVGCAASIEYICGFCPFEATRQDMHGDADHGEPHGETMLFLILE